MANLSFAINLRTQITNTSAGYGYLQPLGSSSSICSGSKSCQSNRQWGVLKIKATSTIEVETTTIFPAFLPPQVQRLRDSNARALASRIERLPVQTSFADKPIMTSCIRPCISNDRVPPLLLLHGFDSSCLEWRNTYPKLEDKNLECWAVDILGWGFSNLDNTTAVNVAAKREHLYEFWRKYLKKPMILVGASLGGAAAIDFTLSHPEAVSKLILVNAQGYAQGTGKMSSFPKALAYAGIAVLKSVWLRTYANFLIYHKLQYETLIDQMNIGRLHCFMPNWENSSVEFMLSGGYNVASRVQEIDKETLIVWGEQDRIISRDTPHRFKHDLRNAKLAFISECGHLPHLEKPEDVAALISEFCKNNLF